MIFFICKIKKKNREINFLSTHDLAFETWWYSKALVVCPPSLSIASLFCPGLLPALPLIYHSPTSNAFVLTIHFLYLLFVTFFMCALQAHTGMVGQQGSRAWDDEEKLTSVHFITWSQITSQNGFNSKHFLCHSSATFACSTPDVTVQRLTRDKDLPQSHNMSEI